MDVRTTEISRRTMLAAAAIGAAGGGMSLGGGSAGAAAPPASDQAPGVYRYKIGSLEVTVATDGARTFPMPDNFVVNAKKDEIEAALKAAYMEPGKMTIVFNPVVVNTGGKLVAIDTGNGAAAFEQSKGAVGQFQANLKAGGIDPATIDVALISHFHGDHINGLLTADGKPAFPNAEILVPQAEWAFWSDDGNMSKAAGGPIEGNFKNARRVFGALGNKVTPYANDKEVVAGITPIATPGHTPGHTSFILASGNAKVLLQSDITNHPALFVRNPGWHAVFDMDGDLAEKTRRRMFDMASAEKLLVQGFHFPFPSAGYVEKNGTGYRLVPVAWSPTL